MPITVKCDCGKRTSVSDVLAGKNIRCPQCGSSVYVGGTPTGPRLVPKKAREAIYIPSGLISLIGLMVVGVGLTIAYRMGPSRVWSQWDALVPKADGEVNDVVTFALQSYLSQTGDYNPKKARHRPAVDGPVTFERPLVVMTMPERLAFYGMTDQGRFSGYYNTRNGEIQANIAYGGKTSSDLLVINKGTGVISITGRDVNGFPPGRNGRPETADHLSAG